MTDEELRERFDAVGELVREVANRIDQRIDGFEEHVDRRLGLIEGRLDRMENQMLSFTKAINDHDRLMVGMVGTQEAQRRAIDDIVRRMNPPQ